MTTLYIQIDDAAVEVAREKAKNAGKTLEAWVADVVHQQAAPADGEEEGIEDAGRLRSNTREWVKDILAATEHPKGNSGGWKFNREEIYER